MAELTREQKEKIEEYCRTWSEVGKDITLINKNELCRNIDILYKELCQLEPPVKVFFDSPMSCLYGQVYLAFLEEKRVRDQLIQDIQSQEKHNKKDIENMILIVLHGKIYNQLMNNHEELKKRKLWDDIVLPIKPNKEDSELKEIITNKIHNLINSQMSNWWYGQHNASWIGYYTYCKDVFKIELGNEKLFYVLSDIVKNSHWILPYDTFCFMSERPLEIHINTQNQLHRDGGAAIRYKDGFSIWVLNNVRVTREIAETPFNKLDAHLLVKEGNAEVRREISKKIGAERICKDLNAKELERGTDHAGQQCRLLSLDLGDGRYRPFIELIDPSTGDYMVEGVSPEIRTLDEAFAFRNKRKDKPTVLS